MNAEDFRAFTVFKSLMSDDPLPLAPDRGTSLTPVDVVGTRELPASAGSATRRGAQGMAVALAAIFLAGFTLGFFLGVLHS